MKTNYIPSSISFTAGFFGPKSDVGFVMVADQDQAHGIIKSLIQQGRNVTDAQMGLDGDWDCNSCTVYEDGEYKDYTEWDNSMWAEPILIVNFSDGPSETYPVWTREEHKPISR